MSTESDIQYDRASLPRYIAVEGVIGAGKTTVATLLSQRLNGRLILERFEENPFLESFYDDPERFAFQTQMFFLLSRFRQLQAASQPDLFHEQIVTDYTFEKDRIFASLTLDENEFQLYENVLATLKDQVHAPDLIVFLQCSLNRLIRNIRDRGRSMEDRITVGYLQDLSDAYGRHFLRYSGTPTLIVNTLDVDFASNGDAVDALVREIARPDPAPVRLFQYSDS